MKASQPKETRPHKSLSSTGVPSTNSLKTHKGSSATGKGFSKPGWKGGEAATRPPKPGQGPRFQGSKGNSAGTIPPSSTNIIADKDSAEAAPSTKVKKPKPPKIPLDPNEHISQRAFVGGLAKDVTLADMEGRFRSFGQIKDVYVAKDVDGTCRGFGYITLDTTRKEWQKCVTLFNGAKWKGNVMKIEQANKDWQTRRQEDLEVQTKLEQKIQEAALKKLKKNPTRHAEDMSLITDKNMDGKRGWKRGRFGRPVVTMKLDKMTYDPLHYKNNLERLTNAPGKPLPLDKLIYQIDENEPLPKGKHLSTEAALASFLSKSQSTMRSTTANADKTSDSTLQSTKESSLKSKPTSRTQEQEQASDMSDDRAMMASILAGIDMSPRAMSLDGSDIDGDDGETYIEDLDAATTTGDLFGDVAANHNSTSISRTKRDSRPEDLFGDDDDDGSSQANQRLLSFLDDENDSDEGEDEDEEMKSAEEGDSDQSGEGEGGSDEDDMDDETIKAIAQLQSTSSGTGGLFDDSDDEHDSKNTDESNAVRLKALESRQAELEAAREKQNQLIASTLANIDSKDKKVGHVVFEDSDDYDSEDYEKMEADHARKLANLNKPAKSIFDSDSGSDDEQQQTLSTRKTKDVKDIFDSEDENDTTSSKLADHGLNIKEQFEGPGGKALFKMQTKIGTSDSRFQLTKDFIDDRIREEDDADYVAHQDRLKAEQAASSGASGIVLDEDRQAESDITAEKMQHMNILRAMFGDSAVRSKKKEEDTARQAKGGLGFTMGLTTHYDPDKEPVPQAPAQPATSSALDTKTKAYDSDSDSDEVEQSKHHSEEDDQDQEEDSDQDNDEAEESTAMDTSDQEQDTQPGKKSVGFSFAFDAAALNSDDEDNDDSAKSASTLFSTNRSDTDNTPKFQVASDLKSLFAPSTGTFKMFGDDDDEDDDQADNVEDDRQADAMDEDRSKDEILTSYTDGARTIFTSGADALSRPPLTHSGSLFFFHFNNPSLLKRSNFKTDSKVFMRTTSMDEVTSHWEKTRRAMTQEFKRKHKSASRNKARASKRLKTGGGGSSAS
ncbi:hypothetical protein B0O80DRAFT_530221 [Mortierella sp. GBAus27b]|nr:nucleolar protein 8 [Mortierella sp. GBA43]KAI8352273.1 hypothetical protein B0O80DRAFT_530221 [Mortierella sp. GBAus27b]